MKSQTKFWPDRFSRLGFYWIQTDRQTDRHTDKQIIYIDYFWGSKRKKNKMALMPRRVLLKKFRGVIAKPELGVRVNHN